MLFTKREIEITVQGYTTGGEVNGRVFKALEKIIESAHSEVFLVLCEILINTK